MLIDPLSSNGRPIVARWLARGCLPGRCLEMGINVIMLSKVDPEMNAEDSSRVA
jgi:hypothetical protein